MKIYITATAKFFSPCQIAVGLTSEGLPLTSFGYSPMINGLLTEYSTVYPAMKKVKGVNGNM